MRSSGGPARPGRRWYPEAALVFNTLIWGATFVMVKEALASVSTLLFLALRFSLATVALGVLFRRAWSHPRAKAKSLAAGILAGIFLFSGYLFQTLGLRLTSAPKSAFITGLCTVLVPFLGWFVYRKRPRLAELAGVFVATAGMGLMTLDGAVRGVSRGDFLTFLCAIGFAAQILTVGYYSGKVSFEILSVAQIGTSAVLSLGLFWWVEPAYIHWQPSVIWAILVTGLLATALAFTVQAWAQRYTTSTRTALIYTLEPVFAWITSYLLTGESLSGSAAVGAGLILSGVLIVEMKPSQRGLHPSL